MFRCARCDDRGWRGRQFPTSSPPSPAGKTCQRRPLRSARRRFQGTVGNKSRPVRRFQATPCRRQIGRASCRGRGEISGVGGSFKKKRKKKNKNKCYAKNKSKMYNISHSLFERNSSRAA